MVERSAVHAELELFIRRERARLVRERLSPWRAMIAGRPVRCVGHDGVPVDSAHLAFSGSLADRFWGFFDPFLRDFIVAGVRRAVELADERGASRADSLDDAAKLLRGCVRGVYAQVRRTAGALSRATGGHDSVRRDTGAFADRLFVFIDEVAAGWLPSAPGAEEPEQPPSSGTAAAPLSLHDEIMDALRRAGRRMTTRRLAEALGRGMNDGTLKRLLAALGRDGLLTNASDHRGRGFGLPSWDAEPR